MTIKKQFLRSLLILIGMFYLAKSNGSEHSLLNGVGLQTHELVLIGSLVTMAYSYLANKSILESVHLFFKKYLGFLFMVIIGNTIISSDVSKKLIPPLLLRFDFVNLCNEILPYSIAAMGMRGFYLYWTSLYTDTFEKADKKNTDKNNAQFQVTVNNV